MPEPRGRSDVVVVGAGVVGLTAAHALSRRGLDVEVWARELPPATTSAVAGAVWYPFLAEPRARVLGWSAETFRRLEALAAEPAAGVRMRDVVEVFAEPEPDLWWASAVPSVERLAGADVPDGFAAAVRARVPVVDVPVFLPWFVRGLGRAGVRFVRRELRALDEAFDRADAVVNCSGLGARELCGDRELRAVRGQVLRYTGVAVGRVWIDDTRPRPCYVIPRGRDVVVGGSADPGDERLRPDAADTAAIAAAAARAVPALAGREPAGVAVGLRPVRTTVRLEREHRADGRCLVHDYGHGGSGYTIAWGCAEEVAGLVAG